MHRGRRGAAPSQSVLSAALTLRYRTKIGGFAWISRVTYLAGDVWELVLPAVFKTVCGALLRRPGWVRFPSIPAKFDCHDSQDDSNSRGRLQAPANAFGRTSWVTLAVDQETF